MVVILTVSMVLFGTVFPDKSMLMDSSEACAMAQASMLSSGFAQNIRDAGGTYNVTCTAVSK